MTAECGWGPEAAAYALGALDDDEARTFVAHLSGCPECAQEVTELQRVVDVMGLAAPQIAPSPALRDRIMRDVEAEAELLRAAGPRADRVPGRRRSRLGWLTARPAYASLTAAALLAAGAVGGVVATSGSDDGGSTTVPAGPRASVALHDGRAALHVARLASLQGGQVYQVWLQRRGGHPVPTHSLFNVRPDGRTVVDVDERVSGYDKLLVTVEPSGGSEKPTGPPVVAADI